MYSRFSSINDVYRAIENLHTSDKSFKSLRYIDQELSSYTKLFLSLGAKKSGNVTPTQLDTVLNFHTSLRNQVIVDPFSMERHKALSEKIREIDLTNIASPNDQSILDQLMDRALVLMGRENSPSMRFLQEISSNLEGSVLVTFRREATIKAARDFFDGISKSHIVVDSLHRPQNTFSDHNLIFGPIHWFNESIINNPRGLFLLSAMPAHVKFRQPEMQSYPEWFSYGKSPLFRDLESSVLLIKQEEDERIEDLESSVPIFWNTSIASSVKSNDSQSLCKQFALANGKQVFIGIDGGEQDFVHSVDVSPNGTIKKIDINPRDLQVGDFIILREGQSDTEVLYQKARELIGAKITQIESDQAEWKRALKNLLQNSDLKLLNRTLRDKGLTAINRLQDWTSPNLRRPLRDGDFIVLLQHLKLDENRFFKSATELRRAIIQVAMNFRQELEEAVNLVSPQVLLNQGFHVIQAPVDGVAGLFISKIVGISPTPLYVDSQRIRVPFDESSIS